MYQLCRYLFLFFVLSLPCIHTVQASIDRSDEVLSYLNGLQSEDITKRITTAKLITKSGINDKQLSELLARLIDTKLAFLSSTPTPAGDVLTDEMAWFCKALASSGDTSYEYVFQKVIATASNDKVKLYAQKSLAEISSYAQRNTILNDTEAYDATLSREENRYVNMLRSQDTLLKRDGAKYILRANNLPKKVYDILNKEILNTYQVNSRDRNQIDAVAWMMKALTSSRDKKYVPTFLAVLKNSKNIKLQRYAENSLKRLDPSVLPDEFADL